MDTKDRATDKGKERVMKIGDEVYVHGYVDEIRICGQIIIRNDGGYFGTIEEEVHEAEDTDCPTDCPWK